MLLPMVFGIHSHWLLTQMAIFTVPKIRVIGDDHEELNLLQEGAHYGFPWRMGLNRYSDAIRWL